jgi:hypothetical protein
MIKKSEVVAPKAQARKDALGFLNLQLVDVVTGKRYGLPTGLRLIGEGKEQLLLDAEAVKPGREFNLIGTVHLMNKSDEPEVITI